ncbi:WW domain-containing protein [Aspergillus lucknowensis]|uniref:WW domain-containing protein n=1 Tax=Aspergillus lucknowensis TaxID=176173 RepID=A0ABR4LG06_9EURO
MSFAPPPGPPPPSAPEGWTTQFDDTYKQWFFVNLATGKSQWEPPQATPAPTPPAVAPVPPSEQPHTDQGTAPPPSYEESGPGNPSAVASAEDSEKKKANLLGSNNPYNAESSGPSGSAGPPGDKAADAVESDAELAARLQAEEDARSGAGAGAGAGAASNYYTNDSPHSPSPASAGTEERGKEKKKGFFSKLMSKASSGSPGSGHGHSSRPVFAAPHHHQPPVGYGGGYPPQGHYGSPGPGPGYGGPGGYYPQQGYGPGYGPQPGYGYPQPGFYGQPQRRRPGGGGMGMAGAAALGVGGGLIGGALLADAIDDDHDDFGGGDDFGGDF